MQRLWMIIRGNWYRATKKNQKLYAKRMSFCATCPHNSKNKAKLTVAEKAWNILGDFCTQCGCPLESKLVEPLSECPILKWGQEIKPNRDE